MSDLCHIDATHNLTYFLFYVCQLLTVDHILRLAGSGSNQNIREEVVRTFYKVLGVLIICTWVIIGHLPNATHADQSSKENVQGLDSNLARALKHYYDKDYEKALPLFQEIANHIETRDLMFLIGRCEVKTGKYDAAIEKFQQILSQNPELYKVRLELADTFFMAGRYKEAGTELKKIQAASAPESILNEVDKRYVRIGGIKKFNWRLSLYLGGEYDDNINSGPDRTEINTPGGSVGLSRGQQETSSYNFITGLNYYGLYDVGEPSGFFWNGALDAYYSVSEEDSDFNYLSVNVSTGPLWQSAWGIVKMPVGYMDTSYGEEHLTRAFYFEPNIEHFFNEHVSIQGTYELTIEDYTDSEYRDYDNTMNRVTIGPNIYLNDMRQIISCGVSLAHRDADADRTTFDAVSFILSYYTKFSTNTEVLLKYKWRERQYDGPSSNTVDDREDDRHTFNATVGQEFFDRYFMSLGFTYMDNDSNDELFDFDKTVYTLKVGRVFK
jgi:tetratricopeptide (TPR) repeat protein